MSQRLHALLWWPTVLVVACSAQTNDSPLAGSAAALRTDNTQTALAGEPRSYALAAGAASITAGTAGAPAPEPANFTQAYDARDGAPLAVTATSAPTKTTSEAGPSPATPSGDRVWRLAAVGFAPVDIARAAVSGAAQDALQFDPVYMCPTEAADQDRDGICDLAEARYGTDAASGDTDGDSLPDAAELYGSFTGGVMYDIKALGASPKHKDIFVEVDYAPGFAPAPGVKREVEDAFAAAPLHNPDGVGGIHLVVEIAAAALPEAAVPDVITDWAQVDKVKNGYFDANRRLAFHYALFAKRYDNEKNTSSGRAPLPGADLIVTLDGWGLDAMAPQQKLMTQAGTLMHELGHNLGLDHGGFALSVSGAPASKPDSEEYKPHYLSIMNYNYQTDGLVIDHQPRLDYARYAVQGISELEFFEPDAFTPANSNSRTDLTHYGVYLCTDQGNSETPAKFSELLLGTASAALDLNRSGTIDTQKKHRKDLNGNKRLETFAGIDSDWEHIDFSGIVPSTGVSRVVAIENPCASAPVGQRELNREPDVDEGAEPEQLPPPVEGPQPPPSTPQTQPEEPADPEPQDPPAPREPEPQNPDEPEPQDPDEPEEP